jgi:hypothetical protein
MRAAWQDILLNLVADAQRITKDVLPETVKDQLLGTGERAADWARTHAGDMVTAVTQDQRASIRDTVGRVFNGPDDERLTPGEAARTIRSTVGLTPRQNGVALKLRDELVDRGLSAAKVETGIRRYGEKARAYRADLIARTETVGASMQGQQAQWADAAAQGLIPPGEVTRVWLVTLDDRLDTLICAPMDNQRTGLSGFFVTGDGREIALPPAHPGCRCTVILELPK